MARFLMDFLGGARYPKTVIENHPRAFGFGCFYEVDGFGNAHDLIKAVAEKGISNLIRIHLMWDDDHRFGGEEFQEIVKRARKLSRIVERHPGISWYISGACEHRLNRQGAENLSKLILNVIPSFAAYVNSPDHSNEGKGAHLKADSRIKNEVHGNAKAENAQAYSTDGLNCVDINIQERKETFANVDYFGFWNCQFNGLEKLPEKGEERPPRPSRKGWPTTREIDSIVYLAREKGKTKLPSGWLYKSHADRHATPPEPRAGEPLFITPKKFNEIKLVACNGQTIGVARYDAPFKGGGYIHRIDDWGYLLAEKARRIQGGDLIVDVVAGGKKIGLINPAFRDGKYR